MKVRIFLPIALGFALCSVQPAFSQHIVPGIIAGASFNSVDIKDIPDATANLTNMNGVEAGVYLNINAGIVYIKPMALASFLKGTVTFSSDGTQQVESKFELSTLETPLIIGFKLFPGIAIEAGPSWNYLMSYTKDINDVNLDVNRNSVGYRAGLRAAFSRLGVFAHYGGIIDLDGNSNYDLQRPSRIIFGATFDLVGEN